MTRAARFILLSLCVFIPASVLSTRQASAQRGWHQGDTWLKWNREAREAYLLGFFEGSTSAQSREQGPGPQGLELNTSKVAKAITDFYTRYPEDRDIYIQEVIEQLNKGLTLEQIHAYPFWRHQPPKAGP